MNNPNEKEGAWKQASSFQYYFFVCSFYFGARQWDTGHDKSSYRNSLVSGSFPLLASQRIFAKKDSFESLALNIVSRFTLCKLYAATLKCL